MKKTWRPSAIGGTLTGAGAWAVQLNGEHIGVLHKGRQSRHALISLREVSQTPGMVWAEVRLTFRQGLCCLDGIPNDEAAAMVACIHDEVVKRLGMAVRAAGPSLIAWAGRCRKKLPSDRWITHDDIETLTTDTALTIDEAVREIVSHPLAGQALNDLPEEIAKLARRYVTGWSEEVNHRNAAFLRKELAACQHFFNHIETNPLTDEQAEAVVRFDNRVLVVAAAGSGKTSTLVAKAGYALYRHLVPGDSILMLAFNADAAEELEARVKARLHALPGAQAITVRTFHSFGLSVIGQVNGKKPALAPWLEQGNGIEEIDSIITALRASDLGFAAKWGLYRVVFDRDLPKFESPEEPEDWDADGRRAGFRTHRGEIVKSREEQRIADWLFYNGVDYVYEGAYEVDTADSEHRRYQPDFFYPAARLYHEHFALDANGHPPAHFKGDYLDGVAWKRRLHEQHGTALIETTSAGLRSGADLERLANELEQRGVKLDPRDDREPQGRPICKNVELAKTFRTFHIHVKSNRIGIDELRTRMTESTGMSAVLRQALFLDLFGKISAEWQRRLEDGNYVDFEDMLNRAADFMSEGKWKSPYRLVLVDEFQDCSRARARLVQGLSGPQNVFLVAVGDDWQSINRFAGADIGVMTSFGTLFGRAHTLFLTTTFRCPQSLCDVSSSFISVNPAQIKKRVCATNERKAPSVVCYALPEMSSEESVVEGHLSELHEKLKAGTVPGSHDGNASLFLLGRYRHNRPGSLSEWRARFGDVIDLEYHTVHGSKGLEADYVMLLDVTRGLYGFPSEREDDPIHQLAMPDRDSHPFAEERRLFYVALTRARRLVMIYTRAHRVSQFLVELNQDEAHPLAIKNLGDGQDAQACECGLGVMVRRQGRHGPFWGCSRFPACNITRDAGEKRQAKAAIRIGRPGKRRRA